MYEFEASSLGYCHGSVEKDSGEGACCDVCIYLPEPGVLKSKVAERSRLESILALTGVHHISAS